MTEDIKAQINDVRHQVDEMLAIPAREIERAERARRTALRFHILTVALVAVGIVGVAGMAYDNRQNTKQLLALEHDRVVQLEATVSAQEVVIAQAVAGIREMADEIERTGGDVPRIELNPALGPPTTVEDD